MVKTVTTIERERPKREKVGVGSGPPPRNGSNGNGSRKSGDADNRQEPSGEKARIAMWIGMSSILMLFAALVSAYVVLATGNSWVTGRMPLWLWLSTALILVSSFTFSKANRALKRGNELGYTRWLAITVGLGVTFLGSQLLAWTELIAQGVYQASSQYRSFFYVLTGVHAVHLIGGLLALSYLLARSRKPRTTAEAEAKANTAAGVIALYWHFMDGLWVFLFLLLMLWK
jgi:cytochrome c oxidase subunit 3